MISLSKLLFENVESGESDTFQMYHGGKRWALTPNELYGAKQGRYESGIGINFTNNYETAKSYAGGSRVVHLVSIDRNITDIENVSIELDDVLNFVKNLPRLKRKKEITADLLRFASRTNRQTVPASVLNNLVINHEAGSGEVGLEIVKYFLKHGIDGVFTDKSGNEVWFILFNLSKIKGFEIVNPRTLPVENYMLPKPK